MRWFGCEKSDKNIVRYSLRSFSYRWNNRSYITYGARKSGT